MEQGKVFRFGVRTAMAMAMLAVCASGAPSQGIKGGDVLPPDQSMLSAAAGATAVFNSGGSSLPAVQYQILAGGAGDYTVNAGTLLYVPIFFADDSPPMAVPGFPRNLNDKHAVADYLIASIDAFAGVNDVVATFVEVDGQTTILGNQYTVGVTTPSLPDGGGTHYIVSGVFLAPLPPGTHTVGVGAVLSDGTPIGPPGYTVTVK
ncbi:MAG TPA: hypothetical protein VG269_02160 [Tepidisphaeraceae bacterium]|jgi:hypothetical protein|nr:hypothetical protein [Tepidisphaeraceae bacterium]